MSPAITNNLLFLHAEVSAQLDVLHKHFSDADSAHGQHGLSLVNRSGYIYQLLHRIQAACMAEDSTQQDNKVQQASLGAAVRIARELDRLAHLARHCVKKTTELRGNHKLSFGHYLPIIDAIRQAMDLVELSLAEPSNATALKLSKFEGRIRESCAKLLDAYTLGLKRSKHPQDLVIGLLISQHLQEMGEALTAISDAVISRNIGHHIDVQGFKALRSTIEDLTDDKHRQLDQVAITPVAQTKSGSGIARVEIAKSKGKASKRKSSPPSAIFKDGEKKKIKEELERVETWHELYPGVAPQVLTYTQKGSSAALLIEHLQGLTFEQLVLHGPNKSMRSGMSALKKTLHAIWKQTKQDKPIAADFIRQTRKRLRGVYAIHPQFRQKSTSLCGHDVSSLDDLLQAAQAFEQKIPAPFSVFIHGDFNVDNIIYDTAERRIHFIDLHRSCYMDYAQDVSVFMVSNFRLEVLDKPVRRRVALQAQGIASIGRDFARRHKDHYFECRLALGLARSLITSTRFIMDRSLAERMFFRARYLLEQLLTQASASKKARAEYRVPVKELFGG